MSIVDCSCRGINPECEKCEGKGYYNTDNNSSKSRINFIKKTEDKSKEPELSFEEKVKNIPEKGLRIIIQKLVKEIDFIAIIQTNIIQSISFNHARIQNIYTQIEKLKIIENDKKKYRKNLEFACKQAELQNLKINIRHKRIMATKDIDDFSNEDFEKLKKNIGNGKVKSSKI
jgi:hypothetical protein